jgi:hypothetical protein
MNIFDMQDRASELCPDNLVEKHGLHRQKFERNGGC